MKLRSLNIGTPKDVEWNGKTIRTGIFKYPVEGPRKVSFLNIEGDGQADLRFHGGHDKAVYSYDQHYYNEWQQTFEQLDFSIGIFGENLTTEGLLEENVKMGNTYKIGTVLLQAMQPRIPCFKLNIRFQDKAMVDRFYQMKRHGIYFRVLKEGHIKAGDSIELVETSPYSISIADVATCFSNRGEDPVLLNQILDIPFLPERIRQNFLNFKS